MPGDLSTAPRIISLSPLTLVTGVTDATLRVSGLWLGTRKSAGGTATLTKSVSLAAAHGFMNRRARRQKNNHDFFLEYNFQELHSLLLHEVYITGGGRWFNS